MPYVIHEDAAEGFELRGAVRTLWSCHDPEVMVSGPAETGKTIGCLLKVHALLLKYPHCSGVMARKTYKDVHGSVGQSYENKILGKALGKMVTRYGGAKPEWYDYPNGSRLWIVGLDNPGKVLSAEHDFIYVNQSEEVALDDWETMLSRTTGRAGHMPYAQLFGDCNPGPPFHWIKQRFGTRLLSSKHEDNPLLYDADGNITEQGKRSLSTLSTLTGVRLQRLRFGIWAGSEGLIYDNYDPTVHVIKRVQLPRMVRYIEIVDFGYTNPFCWQRWGIDGDGRMYLVREIYFTQRLVEDHCRVINRIMAGEQPADLHLCDHDAEDRATYERHRGVKTKPAIKDVRPGIEAVQARLRVQGDGKPRLYFVEDALYEKDPKLVDAYKPACTSEEIENYIWNESKDEPVKANDHGMDNMRYAASILDKVRHRKRHVRSYAM